jgi:uncharacterized protein YxjI
MLGLQGDRKFLLQHQLISAGHNYRVLNHEKRHLFTVKEQLGQEMTQNFWSRTGPSQPGFHVSVVRVMGGSRTFLWVVEDSAGNISAHISIGVQGMHAVSALTDASGGPLLFVDVDRGFVGGLNATATYPDGRPMFQTKGNLIRHNFSIHGPTGEEVAKIHEDWASVRDTYSLDIVGNVDALYPLIFAILIDREKQTN